MNERPRFGVTIAAYPDGVPRADWWWRFAERAEALGFDSLWAGEHVLYHTPTVSASILLAGFAARTRRIRLGTAIYLLPLRHPTLAAKDLSTLDLVSDGRLILGIGVGGEYGHEFEACGVPLRERGSRTDEALEILRRLWREHRVSFAGRHFAFDGVSMLPKPVQPGGPPIWIGGRSDTALRRAARSGDGYFPYLLTPARYRDNLARLATLCTEAGRDPSTVEPALLLFVSVGADREAATRIAGSTLTRMYNQPFDHLVARYCALGTPADCGATIEQYVAAGVRHVVFNWACPQAEILDQMERVARDVLPRFGGGTAALRS